MKILSFALIFVYFINYNQARNQQKPKRPQIRQKKWWSNGYYQGNAQGDFLIFDGSEGIWGPGMIYAPANSFLCGLGYAGSDQYGDKVQGYTWTVGIDYIKAFWCDATDWTKQSTTDYNNNRYGQYATKMCNKDSYVYNIDVYNQDYQNYATDFSYNKGIVSLKIYCYNKKTHQSDSVIDLGISSSGSTWKYNFNKKFINGLQVQVFDNWDDSMTDSAGITGISAKTSDFVCQPNQMLFNNKDCYDRLNYCATQSNSNCLTCNQGYILQSNVCYPVISNCASGSQQQSTCNQCNCGYDLNGNASSCIQCIPGMIPSTNGQCTQQLFQCQTQRDNTCQICQPGYKLLPDNTCSFTISCATSNSPKQFYKKLISRQNKVIKQRKNRKQ